MRFTPDAIPDIKILPGKLPFIGHTHQLFMKPMLFKKADRPQLSWVNQGKIGWSVLITGDSINELLKNQVTDSSLYVNINRTFGLSMIAKDGKHHRSVRGALGKQFTPSGLKASAVGQCIADVFDSHIKRWPSLSTIAIGSETNEMALNVIFKIIGVPEKDIALFAEHYKRSMKALYPLPVVPGSPTWYARQSQLWLYQKLDALFDSVETDPYMQDTMLAKMANTVDENGQRIPREELIDNLNLLLIAGHETTASTLSWMTTYLAKQPELWARLCEEVNATDCDPLEPADLKHFPFAEALFRESLRLAPAAPIVQRRLNQDVEVYGTALPAGLPVLLSISSLCWDAEKYPDPFAYKPQRWLGREKSITPAESIQFGGGPHFCLGYHLALMEGLRFTVVMARTLSAQGKGLSLSRPVRPGWGPTISVAKDTRVDMVAA